jgi:hypothetical protein
MDTPCGRQVKNNNKTNDKTNNKTNNKTKHITTSPAVAFMTTPCGRQVRQAKTRAKYNPIMKMKALYNPIMGAGFSVRPKLGKLRLYLTLSPAPMPLNPKPCTHAPEP